MNRGFGVSAAIPADFVAPLALAAEAAGYATFWVNDVPGHNGLEQLHRAQLATQSIRLGVGVLPVDRWSATQILNEINQLELDPARLDMGLGAGNLRQGSLEATQNVLDELRSQTHARVLIGALGPRMVYLAGASADGVVLNWVTPSAAADLAQVCQIAARGAGKDRAHIVAYVRTSATPAAFQRLTAESEAYEGYPSYRRHFDRMGVRGIETTINGSTEEIAAHYAAFEGAVDEIVCRAISASDSLYDYMAVLDAAKPASLT